MKPLRLILLLQLLSSVCFGQTAKEQQFIKAVMQIVTAFSRHDSATVASYVNREMGFYLLDRLGVSDHYNHFTKLSFSDTTYPNVLFGLSKGIQALPLTYAKLPIWDCDNEVWSKKGLFVDTSRTDHLLSQICKDRNKYVDDTISVKTIGYFYNLECRSRRVVLYDKHKKDLVFYLSYLDNKWYLTVVDSASSDCSV